MSTSAKEALKLVTKGEAVYRSIGLADPFSGAEINYVYIPKTGEYVYAGESRLASGTLVVPSSLRGAATDFPSVYERMGGRRFLESL